MNDTTLMVVNLQGKLRILFCPFRVICIAPVGTLVTGTTVWVERVTYSPGPSTILLYQIYGTQYIFTRFAIQINF